MFELPHLLVCVPDVDNGGTDLVADCSLRVIASEILIRKSEELEDGE